MSRSAVILLGVILLAGCEAGPAVRLGGIVAPARSVVYVIDATGADAPTFAYVQAAVLRSIRGLSPEQRFGLVLFGAGCAEVLRFDGKAALAPASPANCQAAGRFMFGRRQRGPADEESAGRAMQAAFEIDGGPPQAVFLVAQRPWGKGLLERVSQLQRQDRLFVRIHTIGFINPQTQPVLKQLAGQSSGQFRFIDAVNLGKDPEGF